MPRIHELSTGPAESRSPETLSLPHILLVIDGFPKTLGGGERVVLRLASLLPQYGYRVSILTLAIDPASSFQPKDAPCPLYLLPLQRTYDLAALSGALALRRFLKNQQVAIVQTFFESSDLWAGSVARLLSPAKLIWSRRDMGILRGRKHSVAYRLLRWLPDAVFAVSEQVRQHVVEVDGISPERVQTVYNGLDLQPADGSSRSLRGPRRVVSVGNIRHVKGHDLLIRAAGQVVREFPDTTFSLAGEVLEPEYFQELQRLVDAEGIREQFRFAGPVTDMKTFLGQADLFVLPSRSEGFSNALIEGMASGIPVIATDVGGNSEAVQEGLNGLIVPPEDAPALARAILRLLADPNLVERMGIEARRAAEARFSVASMMQKTTAEYARLMHL